MPWIHSQQSQHFTITIHLKPHLYKTKTVKFSVSQKHKHVHCTRKRDTKCRGEENVVLPLQSRRAREDQFDEWKRPTSPKWDQIVFKCLQLESKTWTCPLAFQKNQSFPGRSSTSLNKAEKWEMGQWNPQKQGSEKKTLLTKELLFNDFRL